MVQPPLLDATGSVALISGAGGGIGRATVELFQAAGARVVAFDRDAARLPASSGSVLAIAGDATDEHAVHAAVDAAVLHFGKLDYAVSAVGYAQSSRLDAMTLADWKQIMDINLTSAFLLARECYPRLKRPGGAMVLISSTNGRNGGGHLSGAAYAVAKAGIINLCRYLAKEWAPEGLRVNSVMPGPVATPMLDRFSAGQQAGLKATVPLNRFAEAGEIAAAIGYLCSSYAVTMTGACINVSGGLVLD